MFIMEFLLRSRVPSVINLFSKIGTDLSQKSSTWQKTDTKLGIGNISEIMNSEI